MHGQAWNYRAAAGGRFQDGLGKSVGRRDADDDIRGRIGIGHTVRRSCWHEPDASLEPEFLNTPLQGVTVGRVGTVLAEH